MRSLLLLSCLSMASTGQLFAAEPIPPKQPPATQPAPWPEIEWEQLSLEKFAEEAVALKAGSAYATRHLSKAAPIAWERFLGDAQVLARLDARGSRQWLAVAECVCVGLKTDQRTGLRQRIEKRWVEDRKAFAALSLAEAGLLLNALHQLDVPNRAVAALTREWMEAGGDWKEASADQQLLLIQRLRLSPAAPEVAALEQVSALVWEKHYRGQPHKLLGSKGPKPWMEVVPALPAAGKQTGIDELARHLRQKETLAKLTPAEVAEASLALAWLKAPREERVLLVAGWIGASEQWTTAPVEGLVGLLPAKATQETTEQLATAISGAMASARALVQQGKALGPEANRNLMTLERVWGPYVPAAERQALVEGIAGDRGRLAEMTFAQLQQAGANPELFLAWARTEGRWHSTINTHANISRYITREYDHYQSYARQWSREQLAQVLVGLDGVVRSGDIRPEAAKVAAYAFFISDRKEDWAQRLADQIADESVKGDRRARWLLARAYLEECSRKEPNAFAGMDWAQKALAAAESEGMRLDCLEYLISRRAAEAEFDRVWGMVRSTEGQYEQPESIKRIATLKEALAATEKGAAAQVAGLPAKADKAWRMELERRLKTARDRGDQEQIQRYEKLLASKGD